MSLIVGIRILWWSVNNNYKDINESVVDMKPVMF